MKKAEIAHLLSLDLENVINYIVEIKGLDTLSVAFNSSFNRNELYLCSNVSFPTRDETLTDDVIDGFLTPTLNTPSINLTLIGTEDFDLEAELIAWSANNYDYETGASNVINNSKRVNIYRKQANFDVKKLIQFKDTSEFGLEDLGQLYTKSELSMKTMYAVPEASPSYEGKSDGGLREYELTLKRVGSNYNG